MKLETPPPAREAHPASIPGDAEVRSLTLGISKGDPRALGVFYEGWFDWSVRLARSLTRRDESFCLDVVQDAMLRAVRSLGPLSSAGALQRWMSCAVHSAAIDRLRRESRRARHEALAAGRRPQASAGGGSLAALELGERIEWIRRELGKLSSEDRALLRERFEEGKTLREAGKAAGMTGHAAHGRIRRILVRLKGAAREVFGD